jgi:hypothetical protein
MLLDMFYVHRKFEDNPSIDKRTLNQARTRTRALAHVLAVRENEKYLVLATYGETSYATIKF